MAARKNPTYKKLNSIPRKKGEEAKQSHVWLSESEREWLQKRGGISPMIRALIRDARRREEGVVDSGAKTADNENFRRS